MFHARGPAAANDRSPSDDVVRGTATELDAADLRPGLTVAAADGKLSGANVWGICPRGEMSYIHPSIAPDEKPNKGGIKIRRRAQAGA